MRNLLVTNTCASHKNNVEEISLYDKFCAEETTLCHIVPEEFLSRAFHLFYSGRISDEI
jgi:hypothetical protein